MIVERNLVFSVQPLCSLCLGGEGSSGIIHHISTTETHRTQSLHRGFDITPIGS